MNRSHSKEMIRNNESSSDLSSSLSYFDSVLRYIRGLDESHEGRSVTFKKRMIQKKSQSPLNNDRLSSDLSDYDPFLRRPEFLVQPPSDGYSRRFPMLSAAEAATLRRVSFSLPDFEHPDIATPLVTLDRNRPAWVANIKFNDWLSGEIRTSQYPVPIAVIIRKNWEERIGKYEGIGKLEISDGSLNVVVLLFEFQDLSEETISECFMSSVLYGLESDRYARLTSDYLKNEGGWTLNFKPLSHLNK